MTKVMEDEYAGPSVMKDGIGELVGDIADGVPGAGEVRLRDPRFGDVLVVCRLGVEAAEFAALAGIFATVEGGEELAKRVSDIYVVSMLKVFVVSVSDERDSLGRPTPRGRFRGCACQGPGRSRSRVRRGILRAARPARCTVIEELTWQWPWTGARVPARAATTTVAGADVTGGALAPGAGRPHCAYGVGADDRPAVDADGPEKESAAVGQRNRDGRRQAYIKRSPLGSGIGRPSSRAVSIQNRMASLTFFNAVS